MSLLLFYDTETSRLPFWSDPSEDPRQPHIVQIAAALIDSDTREIAASINLTVKPDGWVIESDAQAIHGISAEYAARIGVSEDLALQAFLRLWDCCDMRIGHEEAFDHRIIRIAMKRFEYGSGYIERFKEGRAYCTCNEGRDVCKIPAAGGKGGFKKPKLTEAYKKLFGTDFAGAHTAQGDITATIAVFWAIQDRTPSHYAAGRRQLENTP